MADRSYSPTVSKRHFNLCFEVIDQRNLSILPDYYFNQKNDFFFDVFQSAYLKTKNYAESHKEVDIRKHVTSLTYYERCCSICFMHGAPI